MNTRNSLWLGGLLLAASCGGGGGGSGGSGAAAGPKAPLNLVAGVRGGDVVLDWSASAGAVEYRVYGSDQPDVVRDAANLIATVTTPGAALSGVPAGVPVFVAVSAKNSKAESALSAEVSLTLGPDPLLGDQWHLLNLGQAGGTPGEDVNALAVWNAGITGDGVRIAVVDDGLELGHEDLSGNVVPGKSHNYLDNSTNPSTGSHGTACAGVAASDDGNAVGGMGVAFDARLVGYNLLEELTDSNTVNAMTRDAAANHISSNSWGAPDGFGIPQPSANSWRNAVESGIVNGRGGLGTVYLWAAGNGALSAQGTTDNSNLDGQANFHGVIAIGAVGDDGVKAFYSENGANVLVVAPSMGRANHAITTVDRTGPIGINDGTNPNDYADTNYTNTFNGTSSATPLAAGVVALMLEANPALTQRDVRWILAASARINDALDPDWGVNGVGLPINHKYGFGVVDAEAAVALAQAWVNVGPQKRVLTPLRQPNLPIPDADLVGVSDVITVANSNITELEYVQITFDADNHSFSGDLEIVLTSPSGTTSVLAEVHAQPQGSVPYDAFVFGCARLLGEPADGVWTLSVRDLAPQDVGTFKSWRLELFGS